MAITDITKEVSQLRSAKAIHDRIDSLSRARAAFLLKALLVAGHVTEYVMEHGLGLAETVKDD